MAQPLFSIILASYNAEKTIEKSIQCVKAQNFRNFEFILIDGGSNDRTLSILQSYEDIIDVQISEPDKGIYDAWNKGLRYAKGEWILFIGADDYLHKDALKAYSDFLGSCDVSHTYYISSKIRIISDRGDVKRIFGWPWDWHTFRKMHIVAHPGSIHRRTLFDNFGHYDINFKIAGDYELLLRPKENLNALFLNQITLDMTEGGVSSNLKTCLEARKAQLANRVSPVLNINIGYLFQLIKLAAKQFCTRLGINVYVRKEFTN
ncbi:MAG: glycosyltransferase [Flavobacterium sp.]|nr:MAG: glycosyltransferase [Flavobacterium sp.]